MEAIKRDPKLALVSMPSLGYGALTINIGNFPKADTPLGRDARVRHAFELALDREALSQVVAAGTYQPNAQATSPLSPLYVEEIAPPRRDVAKARALLKEAGVSTPFTVPLIVYNTPQGVQTGEVIQSMAAEAGFAVQVNAMEFGTAITTVQRGDYVMTLGGWSGLLDTDSNAWSFLHAGGALNRAGYSNPQVDELLDRARTVSDIKERRAAYEGVWQQVSKDLPIIYLWTPRNIVGLNRKVAGFHAACGWTAAPAGRASGAMRQTMGGTAMQRIVALACIAMLAFGVARAETTLVVSIAADPTGLDPEAVLNNTSGFVMATIYDGLIRYKPGTVEVEPGLAQSWDVSADGLTYTFHLRKGVKYQDGTPFNAQALIATLDRQLKKRRSELHCNTGPVENYVDFTYGAVASYRAIDDSTVEFKMKEPSAALLASLAMVWNGVVSPTAAAKSGKDFRNHPVGSGPFIFREWRHRDQVVLDANPNYWKGKPKVDHLVFKESLTRRPRFWR